MEPLKDFFLSFEWFTYDPHQSASEQYFRLQREAGWWREHPDQKTAWKGYLSAIVRQFNASFGVDDDDLTTWHRLLAHIGITCPPQSVSGCKALMRGKFINLIDLIDARDDRSRVIRHFESEVKLSEYTKEKNKVFPRKHVDAGALLKYLLRNIIHPDPNRVDPGTQPTREEKKKKKRGNEGESSREQADYVQVSASAQFYRLTREAGWTREDPRQKEAWEDYLEALVLQFNFSYGDDENDLTSWHTLLARIHVVDLPKTAKGCKRLIDKKFINLVDLVDARDDPEHFIPEFSSEVELTSRSSGSGDASLSFLRLTTGRNTVNMDHDNSTARESSADPSADTEEAVGCDEADILETDAHSDSASSTDTVRPSVEVVQMNENLDPDGNFDPVREFFERYPAFPYESDTNPARLFDQLAEDQHWPIGSTDFKLALAQMKAALYQQFDPSIEMPGPDFVEPEPELFVEADLNPTTSTKKMSKNAKRRMKKRLAAMAKASGSGETNEGDWSAAPVILEQDSGQVEAEEVTWSWPALAPDDNQSTSPLISQLSAAALKPIILPTVRTNTRPAQRFGAGPKGGAGFRKGKGKYRGEVKVTSVPAPNPDVSGDEIPEWVNEASISSTCLPRETLVNLGRLKPIVLPNPSDASSSVIPKRFYGTPRLKPQGGYGKNTTYDTNRVTAPPIPTRRPQKSLVDVAVQAGGNDMPSSPSRDETGGFCQGKESLTTVLSTQKNPFDDFFSEWPDYDSERDRTISVATQLNQLRQRKKWWGPRQIFWNNAYTMYAQALVLQFNASYGTDVNDLETWHRVLRATGSGMPGSVDECKLLVDSIHVNLVDLVDASLDPVSTPVSRLSNLHKL
ncbi:hypothetical protein NP233_g1917 [Leucocoprinus birnbaumii]|uniref:Uncharacterized protein n=1 Tax=Leucocoprinus birnbaumii TaxID=56174 RepID=A0AAD5W1Q0_9AGAR|nr:hypothetical protein NP233_g1917 [Leucocoprinus birnbaumii]